MTENTSYMSTVHSTLKLPCHPFVKDGREQGLSQLKLDFDSDSNVCLFRKRALLKSKRILLTENRSGEEVISNSFCFASLSACRDFIKSSLKSKASLALQETENISQLLLHTHFLQILSSEYFPIHDFFILNSSQLCNKK